MLVFPLAAPEVNGEGSLALASVPEETLDALVGSVEHHEASSERSLQDKGPTEIEAPVEACWRTYPEPPVAVKLVEPAGKRITLVPLASAA